MSARFDRQVTVQSNTRYARSGPVSIAYQVVGDGPRDLVFVSGWVSHLESGWGSRASNRL